MLTRSKDTQMDKAKRTMQDVVRYAQEVAGDQRLRADVSAALAHGSKATDQLKKDIQAGGISSRLAADEAPEEPPSHADIRCSEQSCAEEEPSRSELVLVLAGVLAAALALPKIRPRVRSARRTSAPAPPSRTR